MKKALPSLFSFLVSLKSPPLPDSLVAVALVSDNKMIIIGMTRIQAFHKPNSNAGINDNYLPPKPNSTISSGTFLVIQFFITCGPTLIVQEII